MSNEVVLDRWFQFLDKSHYATTDTMMFMSIGIRS